MKDMTYQKTDKDALINEIIDIEFSMFDKVNGMNGRAPCQNNFKTFYAMRYSQHNAFSEKTLLSYKNDLILARNEGRNLITEKYGYMMEFTDRAYYEEFLKNKFPICSDEKLELIKEIADLLEEDFDAFAMKYPYFSKIGRPQISNSHVTTIYIYNYGELKTYSYETLILYRNDVLYSRNDNMTIVEKIQNQTSLFYGYKNIQDAESSLRQKAVEFL